MPMPRTNGSASATVVPVAYRLLENSTTWITTGATQAPASRAETAPMVNASITLPRWPPPAKCVEYFEKSMNRTSNIARPSTTKRTAMPRLNHGDELIVPNVPAVRITTSPRMP